MAGDVPRRPIDYRLSGMYASGNVPTPSNPSGLILRQRLATVELLIMTSRPIFIVLMAVAFSHVSAAVAACAPDARSIVEHGPRRSGVVPTEVVVHQLEAYQQTIEVTVALQLAWFAFATLLNIAVVWALLAGKMPVKTPLIPVFLLLNDVASAVAAVFSMRHFYNCHVQMNAILDGFSHALEPAISLELLMFMCVGIIELFLLMAAGWGRIILRWDIYRPTLANEPASNFASTVITGKPEGGTR